MSTIAAFMLAILPGLDVVTKVTLGVARPVRANWRNRAILRVAMILFFQLLNLGATPKAMSESEQPWMRDEAATTKTPRARHEAFDWITRDLPALGKYSAIPRR
ncbi:MAG TPA: hypothetical protein VGK75_02355 [Casimicrobiaceae bacterium]